ncbi:hypothetical protein OC861_005771 [Tilletia horrida]|nr:hypothetical protein OC861_005771 [Tilletia horrida]
MKMELKKVQKEHPFELATYDIHDKTLPEQAKWQKKYIFDIPVLHVDGQEVLRHRITDKSRVKLLKALQNAREGQEAPL